MAEQGDIIRVRLPLEKGYRNVKLHAEAQREGWWYAWLDKYGYTWSHLGVVHVSWQKGRLGGRRKEG